MMHFTFCRFKLKVLLTVDDSWCFTLILHRINLCFFFSFFYFLFSLTCLICFLITTLGYSQLGSFSLSFGVMQKSVCFLFMWNILLVQFSFHVSFDFLLLHGQWPLPSILCIAITPDILCLGHQIPLGCRIRCKFTCSFFQWHGSIFHQCSNTYSSRWEFYLYNYFFAEPIMHNSLPKISIPSSF